MSLLNIGFRYQNYNVEPLNQSPFNQLVVEKATDFAALNDGVISANAVAGGIANVNTVFTYLAVGEVQQGRDSFGLIPTGSKSLMTTATDPNNNIYNVDFWETGAHAYYQEEVTLSASLGYDGVFLDVTASYFERAGEVPLNLFDGDVTRNSALAMMDAVEYIAGLNQSQMVIANVDPFMLNNARFGAQGLNLGQADQAIADFAAALDGILIENYAGNQQAIEVNDLLSDYTDAEVLIYVTSRLGGGINDNQTVLDFYRSAAKNGFIPFASDTDSFDDNLNGVPIFNVVTDGDDVLGLQYNGGILEGGLGSDFLYGSSKTDIIYGATEVANGAISFADGKDYIDGRGGNDTLYGNQNEDTILGGAGDDTLFGGQNSDILFGGTGNDILNGDNESPDTSLAAGDDIMVGGAGADMLNGGPGTDTASYEGSTIGVVVNLDADGGTGTGQNGDAEGDTLISVENLTGSAQRDFLFGNSGANTINGAGGFDVMQGGAGNDTYAVDNSNDAVIEAVGGGEDAVYSSVDYIISSTEEIETAILTGNAVVLRGSDSNNQLFGNDQINVLEGKGGTDYLLGLGGDDIFQVSLEANANDLDVFGDFEGAGVAGGDRIALDASIWGADGIVYQVSQTSFIVATAQNTNQQQFIIANLTAQQTDLIAGDDYYFG